MNERDITYNPQFSMESHANGTLVLRIHIDPLNSVSVDYVFGPLEALRFVADVTRTGSQAVAEALDNLAVGPCERCSNYRLIVDEDDRQKRRIYCPDCEGRRDPESVRKYIRASAPKINSTSEALK